MDSNVWLPIIISIVALFFSVVSFAFSFWWMHWRTGTLIVSTPLSYRIAKINENGLLVEIPISFYNNGAAPIVIENMYLIITYQNIQERLFFNATRDSIDESNQKTATQFVINGRNYVMSVYSFQARDKTVDIGIGKWNCELFGKTNKKKYISLSKFNLFVKHLDGSAIARLNFDDEYRKLVQRP